jgi:hypothetical protein
MLGNNQTKLDCMKTYFIIEFEERKVDFTFE